MTLQPQKRWRVSVAVFCLFTVALLYAPLGGAAWFVYSRACCTAEQCPIHEHHGSHSPATARHTIDCGHDRLSMTQCAMSCGHHHDRPALAPVIFVLSAAVNLTAPTSFEALTPASSSQDTFSSTEPLLPPPRISFAA
ncbi:MAG TPA: hypothetical protein VNB49_08075 [Candidatus Dormibacteraeota bacterium]|nr:hypothetical protein [Candidatus Dormibacteraeota bacterium]